MASNGGCGAASWTLGDDRGCGRVPRAVEATGDEAAFVEAKRLNERSLAEPPDALVLRDYGYLLECHGRYALARAVEPYRRAIELDPDADKPPTS